MAASVAASSRTATVFVEGGTRFEFLIFRSSCVRAPVAAVPTAPSPLWNHTICSTLYFARVCVWRPPTCVFVLSGVVPWVLCVARLIGSGRSDDDATVLATQTTSELLKVSSMLWHLVEVLFLDDEDDLVPSLLEWLGDHFHERLVGTPVPGSEDAMWDMVIQLVLQGNVRTITRH